MHSPSQRFLDDFDEFSDLIQDLHKTGFLLLLAAHKIGTVDPAYSSPLVLDLASDVTRMLTALLADATAASCEMRATHTTPGIVKP